MIRISIIITIVTCIFFTWVFYERKFKNKRLFNLDITSGAFLVTVLLLIIPYINIIIICGYILYRCSNLFWNLPDFLSRKVKSKLDEK